MGPQWRYRRVQTHRHSWRRANRPLHSRKENESLLLFCFRRMCNYRMHTYFQRNTLALFWRVMRPTTLQNRVNGPLSRELCMLDSYTWQEIGKGISPLAPPERTVNFAWRKAIQARANASVWNLTLRKNDASMFPGASKFMQKRKVPSICGGRLSKGQTCMAQWE